MIVGKQKLSHEKEREREPWKIIKVPKKLDRLWKRFKNKFMKQTEIRSLTERKLKNGMIVLLKDKPLRKITVKELCEAAGVNRTTFYKYYGSPYDLFDTLADEFFEGIAKVHIKAMQIDDLEENLTNGYSFMEEHREVMLTLYRNLPASQFLVRYATMPEVIQALNNGMEADIDPEARSVYFVCGTMPLLLRWLEDENRRTPNEEAKFIMSIVFSAREGDPNVS